MTCSPVRGPAVAAGGGGGRPPRPAAPSRPVPAWWLPAATAAAAAAGCAVVGLVDPTRTSIVPPCPFRALTGLDCPGCGATRAMHALLNGHAGTALGLNLVAVLAVPVVAWLWLAWALPRFGGPSLPVPGLGGRRGRLLAAALVVFTVVRNLPLAPFSGLGT